MLTEALGSVAGPVCHVTLCVDAAAAQWKVIVPAAMLSGVGEKEKFATVIVVECPPGGGGGGGGGGGLPPYPVLLLLHAAAATTAARNTERGISMTPPGEDSRDVIRPGKPVT